MANRVGQQLGRYRLVRLLGQGSFADVYQGEHLYLKSEAAVKVLRTQLAEEDADSFLNEAQTIAHLVHPNIVRTFDFDVQEGTPFLVMDCAPSGTLRQRHLKGIAVPLQTIVQYVKQIADALQYAHNQKFIHRDVKPENMLLGRRNEVLLSDFGIVQVVQNTLSENEGAQKIEGTIAYMAPEQLRGKARFATDQYALGIVVYEWLSGNRPFQGSLSEMASQHLFVPPPSLREKVPTISPAVEEVVMMALAKEPKQRFANVQAFANALEQAAWVTATPSYSDTSPYAPTAPLGSTPPPTNINDSARAQPQIPPPLPTVIASSGERPQLGQQPPAITTSSASSGAGMPVFTDPPAQIQQQAPAISNPSLPAVAPTVSVQPSQAQQYPPGAAQPPYHSTETDPGKLRQQRKNNLGRNLLLIALTALIVAGSLSAYFVFLKKSSQEASPASGIGVSMAADGEYIGLSDGNFAFDTNRPDGPSKIQAVEMLKAGKNSAAKTLWQAAIKQETNDAEALIYLEDQRVLASGHPYITFVIGTHLTGNQNSVHTGRDNLQGAYVAQKEYNDGFKLSGGMQVRLLIASIGSQREYIVPVVQRIVQEARKDKTIVGVMGWPFSTSSGDAIGALAAAQIPMVSPTAYFDSLTGISPYFFRVIPSNSQQVSVGVQYAERTLHAKKAALFVDPHDLYSHEVGIDFEQQFTAGGNATVIEDYTVRQPQMLKNYLQDALKHNPDLIYFAGYTSDVITLLAQLPTTGPFAHLPVMGADGLDGTFPRGGKTNFSRLHFTDFITENTWDFLRLAAKKPAFFTEYAQDFDPDKQHINSPNGYRQVDSNSMFSYDAMLALLTGSQIALAGQSGKAKIFSPNELQRALGMITPARAIQGVSGQISFGPDGNPINKAVIMLKVDPAGYVEVESVKGSFLVGS